MSSNRGLHTNNLICLSNILEILIGSKSLKFKKKKNNQSRPFLVNQHDDCQEAGYWLIVARDM